MRITVKNADITGRWQDVRTRSTNEICIKCAAYGADVHTGRREKKVEALKLSELQFDVLYKDGTKKRVKNGILFEETTDHKLNVHIGTYNQINMLVAVIRAAGEMINAIGRGNASVTVTEHKATIGKSSLKIEVDRTVRKEDEA